MTATLRTLLVPFALAIALGFVPLAWADATRPSPAAPPPKTITDTMPCSVCHTTASWRPSGAASVGHGFDHSTTGFPLTGQHASTPCVDCHASNGPAPRACSSCHEDAHRGRLTQSCDRCHSAVSWRLTRPIDLHRLTRFPLTGMHVLADCTECHRRASEQRFTDAPVACFGCHEQDYRRPGNFPVHTGTTTSAPLPRDCSLCHRAVAWVPAVGPAAVAMGSVASRLTAAPRDHDLRFPITFGVHRGASCSDCHASSASPRAVRCVGCHAHDPAHLRQQHPAGTAPTAVGTVDGGACLGCHLGGARR